MPKRKIQNKFIGEITVQKRRGIKNISMRVSRDGSVVLNLPWFVPEAVGLKFLESKKSWIIKQRDNLPEPLTNQEISNLKSNAKKYLPNRLDLLAKKHGFSYKKVRISSARTRWGSCSEKGVISLNTQLMRLPRELSDYVIVHELCHTRHMNHSPHFWRLVSEIIPDYKARKKAIRNYQIAPSVSK